MPCARTSGSAVNMLCIMLHCTKLYTCWVLLTGSSWLGINPNALLKSSQLFKWPKCKQTRCSLQRLLNNLLHPLVHQVTAFWWTTVQTPISNVRLLNKLRGLFSRNLNEFNYVTEGAGQFFVSLRRSCLCEQLLQARMGLEAKKCCGTG